MAIYNKCFISHNALGTHLLSVPKDLATVFEINFNAIHIAMASENAS